MAKKDLLQAQKNKNDEFYTRLEDVRKGILPFVDHDPNVFRNKTILLPCDEIGKSEFYNFFEANQQEFGVGKIHASWLPTDFRSEAVKEMLEDSDFVITNPPFSLLREMIAWVVAADKKFLLLGNLNAISYRDVFPLIATNRLWLGPDFNKTKRFYVPADFQYSETYKGVRVMDGRAVAHVPACCWLTNIDHGIRHEKRILRGQRELLEKARTKYSEADFKAVYAKYDNAEAIEVPAVDLIPSDYDGVMGVPITFIGSYNPEQFEIVGFRKGDDGKDLSVLGKTPYARVLIRLR
jgi:hypothetical protein